MTEWLTTGEMIDRLKVGEVAENNEIDKQVVTRLKHGEIIGIDPENHCDILKIRLTEPALKSKWRILPNYVSFEEAMKAFKEGKKIRCGRNDGFVSGEYVPKEGASYIIDWEDVQHGKWTIES